MKPVWGYAATVLALVSLINHCQALSASVENACGFPGGYLKGDQVDCLITGSTSVYDPTIVTYSVAPDDNQDFSILLLLRVVSGTVSMSLLNSVSERVPSVQGTHAVGDGYLVVSKSQVSPGQFTIQLNTEDRIANFVLTVTTSSSLSEQTLGPTDRMALTQIYQSCCPANDPPAMCQTLAKWLDPSTSANDVCRTPPNMCISSRGVNQTEHRIFKLFLDIDKEGQNLGRLTCSSPPPALAKLTELNTLDLSFNKLQWPTYQLANVLSGVTKLKRLAMRGTGLNNMLDCGLVGPNVEYLQLQDNDIIGTIPGCFFTSPKLKVLLLGSNALAGPLPDVVVPVAAVQVLDLSAQQDETQRTLIGPIPPSMKLLPQLTYLDISKNMLDAGIQSLPNSLEVLDLGGNLFSGPLPDSVASLDNLRALFLYDLPFTGGLPAGLGLAPNLIWLYINNVTFSGPMLKDWEAPDLYALSVRRTNFSGDLPLALAKLPKLLHLNVADNQLQSIETFTKQLPSANAIVYLNVSNNKLHKIPDLSRLAVFTNFTAPVISEWMDPAMTFNTLDLSNNNMTTTFPRWLPKALSSMPPSVMFVNIMAGNLLTCPKSIPSFTNAVRLAAQNFGLECVDKRSKQVVQLGTTTRNFVPAEEGLSTAVVVAIVVSSMLGLTIIVLSILLLVRCIRNRKYADGSKFNSFKDVETVDLSRHSADAVVSVRAISAISAGFERQPAPPVTTTPFAKSKVMA